jgi:ATP-dependent Clp protease ATP-binding subunit ClpA
MVVTPAIANLIRENTSSVLLLDEMEKANTFVLNLFLQVFDEGWLTDGRGKKVYFSDNVIIMTSNLGSDEFKKFIQPLGFLQDSSNLDSAKKGVMKEVENTFTPEFLNRIDDIIVFNPLTREEVTQISRMYLEKLRITMNKEGRHLLVTDSAIEHLVDAGFSLKYGARFLKRTIDEKVKIPITLRWKEGNYFVVDFINNQLQIACSSVQTFPSSSKEDEKKIFSALVN